MGIENNARLRIDGTELTVARHGRLILLLDSAGYAYTRRGKDGRKRLPDENEIAELVATGEARLLPPVGTSPGQDGVSPRVFRGIASRRPTAGGSAPAVSGRPDDGWAKRFSLGDADKLLTDIVKLALIDPERAKEAYELYRRELKAMNHLSGEGHDCVDPSGFDRRMSELSRRLDEADARGPNDRFGRSSAIH
jgi:hypothetical protein